MCVQNANTDLSLLGLTIEKVNLSLSHQNERYKIVPLCSSCGRSTVRRRTGTPYCPFVSSVTRGASRRDRDWAVSVGPRSSSLSSSTLTYGPDLCCIFSIWTKKKRITKNLTMASIRYFWIDVTNVHLTRLSHSLFTLVAVVNHNTIVLSSIFHNIDNVQQLLWIIHCFICSASTAAVFLYFSNLFKHTKTRIQPKKTF